MQVDIVSAERKLWSGQASMVSAKTLDGEIGILPGHAPVIGILVPGGVVRLTGGDAGEGRDALVVAVHGGFLSVTDNHVSVLAEIAELAGEVDVARARAALDRALMSDTGESEAAAARARARLQAAGEPA